MDIANLGPDSRMLCTALPLHDHQNVVAIDPPHPSQVDSSIDSSNDLQVKLESDRCSSGQVEVSDGHGNDFMNVEEPHRPKLEVVDLNESEMDQRLVSESMDPHRTHPVSTRMQQFQGALNSLPTAGMQQAPLTPLNTVLRKTVHQYSQLNQQHPLSSADLPQPWHHGNVVQCVTQCHTELVQKVEEEDEDRLFEHLVTTMTMPDKRSSLRALTRPMVKRLQHHFKRLVPKCPQCKTSRHVSFRYFNNLKKTSILQPRYICKHPLHPTQVSKREFALPIRQITGSHCQKLPLDDAFRAILNPLTSPCSSSLQGESVDLGLHLSL